MKRNGLLIVLAIAICIGVVFAIYPALDLAIAARLFDGSALGFSTSGWLNNLRDVIGVCIVLLALFPMAIRYAPTSVRRLMPNASALFLWSTLLLAPALMANVILKDHWGRPRPVMTKQFGGSHDFVPWWDPRGDCPANCSFVSGEAAAAAWTSAPAALLPPTWRALAYGASFVLFAWIGYARMAAGGHYFTDIAFAGIFTFFIVWIAHWLIYRRSGRTVDATGRPTDGGAPNWLASLSGRIERTLDSAHAYLSSPSGLWLLVLLLLTVVRLVGLRFSTVDLFFDESQYWAWSRELDFGYFSKPPLLAWIIAAAQGLCGSGEACVRAPAPLFYLGTSIAVYAAARALYDARTASWAALMTASAPGVIFSTRIISTDVPLLLCWSIALLAYVKLWQATAAPSAQNVDAAPRDGMWTIVLGLAFGFGLLAKYAMAYFVLGIGIAAILDPQARALLRRPALWIALAVGLIVVSPNVWWNVQNGFVTFKHTGVNIEGGGIALSPLTGLSFIGSQFGVAGPIIFGTLLVLLARIGSPRLIPADRVLLAFAIPALALVTGAAFVTRVQYANWAATSIIAAIIVVTAVLVRRNAWRLIGISIAIGVVFQAGLLVTDGLAHKLSIPGLAKPDVYARTMGWRALGVMTGTVASVVGARTIAAEQRDDEASLMYYMRRWPQPVLAWPAGAAPSHQFDITRPFAETAPEPVLFVSRCPDDQRLRRQFNGVQPLGYYAIPTGPKSARGYYMFKLDGRRGPISPLGGCG